MAKKKPPLVFVGCTTEAKPVAAAIQVNLEECEVEPWYQMQKPAGKFSFESLVERLKHCDFGVLVVTHGDYDGGKKRKRRHCPRDNVFIELGLCIGMLGPQRTFVVCEESARPLIPSDLAGVEVAKYRPPKSGSVEAALGAACTTLWGSMRKQGWPRKGKSRTATKPRSATRTPDPASDRPSRATHLTRTRDSGPSHVGAHADFRQAALVALEGEWSHSYPQKGGAMAKERARITRDGRYFVNAPSLGYSLDNNPKYELRIDSYEGDTIKLAKVKVKGDEPPVGETLKVVSPDLLEGWDTDRPERKKRYQRVKQGV